MKQQDKQITTLSSLDIAPKDGDLNLGFYLPVMTNAERNAIPLSLLRRGCLIYLFDTEANFDLPVNNGVTFAADNNKLFVYAGDGLINAVSDWKRITSAA